MSYGALTVFLVLCTVVLYIWFFRSKDEDYNDKKNIILDDKKNSEEGKHE